MRTSTRLSFILLITFFSGIAYSQSGFSQYLIPDQTRSTHRLSPCDLNFSGGIEGRWSDNLHDNLLSNPEHVVFDVVNNLYLVTNYGSGRIVAIDTLGNQSVIIEGIPGCLGIHIVDTTICISAGPNIHLYGLMSHAFLQTLTLNVTNWLDGMTDDGAGNLYAAENAGKVHKINLLDFTDTIIVNGGLPAYPQDLAYDPAGHQLFLVCWGINSPIVSIDLTTFAVNNLVSTSSGKYDGIVMDVAGNLYVTSWMNGGRVLKWEPPYTTEPVVFSQGHDGPAGLALNQQWQMLAVPNFNGNSISYLSLVPTGAGETDHGLMFRVQWNELLFNSTEPVLVSVSDISGRNVMWQSFLPGNQQLSLERVPGMQIPGVYIITLKTRKTVRSVKMIR